MCSCYSLLSMACTVACALIEWYVWTNYLTKYIPLSVALEG